MGLQVSCVLRFPRAGWLVLVGLAHVSVVSWWLAGLGWPHWDKPSLLSGSPHVCNLLAHMA